MKKLICSLAIVSSFVFAGTNTKANVSSTMNLLHTGMNMIENAFLYSDKAKMNEGINIVKNANDIFAKIDPSTFLNKKVISLAAYKNITGDMTKNLEALQKSINKNKLTQAGKEYSKVLNNCIACHIIIRKW